MSLTPARLVERSNRFLVLVELESGEVVPAYLPNTGRLAHLMAPGTPFALRYEPAPHRITDYTAVRAWDGCWVALEATAAAQLLVEWLENGNGLHGFGTVERIEREVSIGRHRLDLRLVTQGGPVWVEVKSGGRAKGTDALLSATPSVRAASHLELLSDLVAGGELAAAVFVVQRPDVRRLRIGGDADPGWIKAVRSARRAAVAVVAYGCDVTPHDVHIVRRLPIVDA